MYLFILESIGTSELILIGIVALLIFGPRKLPQMAKTIGKMMAEFRGATNEFKTTWQREASFEEESKQIKNIFEEPVIERNLAIKDDSRRETIIRAVKPEIRQIDASEIKKRFELEEKNGEPIQEDKNETSKRDWL